jgi:hypothetical protein
LGGIPPKPPAGVNYSRTACGAPPFCGILRCALREIAARLCRCHSATRVPLPCRASCASLSASAPPRCVRGVWVRWARMQCRADAACSLPQAPRRVRCTASAQPPRPSGAARAQLLAPRSQPFVEAAN